MKKGKLSFNKDKKKVLSPSECFNMLSLVLWKNYNKAIVIQKFRHCNIVMINCHSNSGKIAEDFAMIIFDLITIAVVQNFYSYTTTVLN